MKLKISQVIGLNTDQKAAQVISSPRDSDNTFLAVIQLTCDDAFTKGRLGLSELSDFYFDFDGTPVEKLTASFKEAEAKFKSEGGFDLVLVAISGKVLYLIGQGNVEVYLKREGKLSALLSVGPPSQLISGFLQDGDKLLLSTKDLITFLGDDLSSTLSLPTESFEEEILDRIAAAQLQGQGLAALSLEVEKEQEEAATVAESSQELKSEPEPEDLTIPSLPEQDLEGPKIEEYSKISVVKSSLIKAGSLLAGGRRYFPKGGRGRLILALVLIVIIALGIGFKYKVSQDQQKKQQFNQTLQSAKDDFNAAQGLASLNPPEAKKKLDSARNEVNNALKLDSNSQEAKDLKKKIEDNSASILQESSVSDFPLFLDMDLIKKNFRASQMSLSTGKLLLLDPAVKTLVVVDLAKKSNQILAGSDKLGEATLSSLNGGLAFVFSKDKGILKIDSTNQKLTTVAKKDSDLGNIADLYAFAGNIYILDSLKNQIWKYLPTADGYSDKREYLTKDTKADLSGSLRMQIESSVYILKQGGEIIRFTRGEKDNFSLGGLPSPVKDLKSIFISSDTDNLYLLDSGNSRLLILTKTGEYKGQMIGAKFASATDLVVDEKGKKVYLLDGSKIFQVDLK